VPWTQISDDSVFYLAEDLSTMLSQDLDSHLRPAPLVDKFLVLQYPKPFAGTSKVKRACDRRRHVGRLTFAIKAFGKDGWG
jgi:hypothetical protein